jgi:DNA-binding NarL/FixJ family response regulator
MVNGTNQLDRWMGIRIIIADDHHLVRQGFRSLLEEAEEIELIGECEDGRQVLQEVERREPDVLLLDLMMPGLNGLEVTRQVSKKTKVLILSMHADETYVLKSLQYGALGYVLKTCKKGELVHAIREVAAGRRYLSGPLSDRAVETYAEQAPSRDSDVYETLTTREREVLQLAAEGFGNKEIASRLCVSHRTVETHRANFMRKLGLSSQADVIRFALLRGILPVDR